ncbi:hypothetical protein [Bradyrhizobium jicamae]|uniref:hypothetical protein n=1 Tax=Bradyrhizobium jicamae TaxID=280332 RepID=UPI002896F21C|nr:hypothetical protein [Bradyrhizobium jicamae]
MAGPQKITFGDMRSIGVGGVLVYCADFQCSHSLAVMADRWADDVRLVRRRAPAHLLGMR